MKITKADANAKIRQAYVDAAPDICDAILFDCKQGKGQVIVMEETRKKGNAAKYIMAAAACLILLFGGNFGVGAYQVNHKVAATISLEVNPSIQVLVNGKERVLDVKALNKDGEIVIGDMDLSGSDINVAINALVGSMLRNGYLNELANSILISVDNNDPEKGAVLQEKLTKEVNKILESDGFTGAVLSQTITESSGLQGLADQYGITLGKAQLIQDILDSTSGHTFEKLVPLSINELNLLIGTSEAETEKVYITGNASDKGYIGEMKAKEIAFAHAGVNEADIRVYEMELDVERGVLVYELDFKCGGYEYEYEIDAQSGDIVRNRKEPDDDYVTGIDRNDTPESVEVYPSGVATETQTNSNGNYSGTSNETQPQYNGNYSGTGHHEEPVQEQSYYNGTHHSESHHGGTGTGNSGNTAATSAAITLEQAKGIALNHAGVSTDAAYFEKAKQDYEDGVLVYEIEFKAGRTEYEYEIDAQTGAIRDYEWDDD